MCNVCGALVALRGSLNHKVKNGTVYQMIAIGEDAEKPAKFQIKKEDDFWGEKWIETDNLANVVGDLGFEIHEKARTKDQKKYLQEVLKELN